MHLDNTNIICQNVNNYKYSLRKNKCYDGQEFFGFEERKREKRQACEKLQSLKKLLNWSNSRRAILI